MAGELDLGFPRSVSRTGVRPGPVELLPPGTRVEVSNGRGGWVPCVVIESEHTRPWRCAVDFGCMKLFQVEPWEIRLAGGDPTL